MVGALPEMGADLGDVSLLPWVVTAYLVASSVSVLAAGPLIDGLGTGPVFRLSIVVFLGASLASALAPSMVALVATRVVQGAASGMLLAVTVSAVALVYPTVVVPRAFAANSAVWGAMGFGGPAATAVLVSTVGWRGVFMAIVPVAAIAAALGWRRLPGPAEGAVAEPFDRRGLALVAAVIAAVTIGLSDLDRWSTPLVAIGLVLASAYWRHAARRPTPVLARRHLAEPFGRVHLAAALALGAALAVNSYLPVYVQGARGRSAGLAAFSVLFLTVGWTAAAQVGGRLLQRLDPTAIAWVGFAVQGPALAGAAAVEAAEAPLSLLLAAYFGLGYGTGTVMHATLTMLQTLAPANELGRANAAHQFVRNVGTTLAIAAGGGVVLATVAGRVGSSEAVRRLLSDEVGDRLGMRIADAIAVAHQRAHLLALGLAIVGLVVTLSLRRRPPGPMRPAPTSSTPAGRR